MPRVLVIFALVFCAWASPAHADDRDRALKLFEDSDKAYKAGKFEEATSLLKEAYGIYPEPILLYNLGRAEEGLGDTRGAVDSYERYLKDAKQIKDRGAIERRIETLKAQIAKQEEDKRRHDEEEARRKREEEERRKHPPPPNDTRSPLEIYGPWATLGAGGLVTLTGIYFGIHASNLHDDALATPIQRDAAELQRSAERSATIANVLIVAGAVTMAGGVAWKIWQLESDDSTQSAQVTVGPGQVAFQWSFP